MKNLSKYITMVMLVAAATSCDDKLNIEQHGVLSYDTYYQTDEEAETGANAMYLDARGMGMNYILGKNMLTDDNWAGGANRADNADLEQLNEFTFGTDQGYLQGMFQTYYQIVYKANVLLGHVQPESPVKERVLAEAKVFRAWAYFELISMWGNPPLVDHELLPSEYSQPNGETAELWGLVEKDLTEAISSDRLPQKSSADDKTTWRVTKQFAQALLGKAFRDEWEYPYMVMTDWFGGKDAPAQIRAGNDMLQPGTDKQYQAIVDAVNNGELDESIVDRNVKRILEMIVKTPKFKGYAYSNNPDLKAHAEVTRQSATEGMVLLKNDKAILPLKADTKNVAVLGCTSYDFIAGGTGSGNVNRAYTVSLLDGLKNVDLNIDESLVDTYAKHIEAENQRNAPDPNDQMAMFMPRPRPTEWLPDAATMANLMKNNDAAIITIGRTSGEFLDRTPADFNLRPEEKQLIEATTKAFHAAGKPVVVVLNVGGVVETASWRALPDAILCAWQAGQEGGNSVADVLVGNASPSGKLPMTFPLAFADHASSANFPTEGAASQFGAEREQGGNTKLWDYTPYEEDVYVGYRYFDSFDKGVAYPFGYGLSYTTFEYSEPTVSEDNGVITVSVDVTNTGDVEGKEVVQLYAKAPNAKAANKPEHELRAFAKTRALKPGEKQTVNLVFNTADLASFDSEKSAWVVDAGEYELQVGASSRDIRGKVNASVNASETPANKVLTPKVELNTLRR